MDSLLPTASSFAALCEFTATPSTSLYLSAMNEGLEEELGRYREALVVVEGELADCPQLPLTHLRHRVAQFTPVLHSVLGVVAEVERVGLRGGPLLNCLHAAAQSGFPAVRATFEALLHRCHLVLFNQLIAWTVYGLLPEGSAEFFIAAEAPKALSASTRPGTARQAVLASPTPTVREPAAASVRQCPFAISYGTPKSIIVLLCFFMQGAASWSTEFAIALDELSSGYTVNLGMVPSRYLPLRVAECVLFVGRAVRLLTQQRFDVTAPRIPLAASSGGGDGRSLLPSGSGESASPGTP